MARVKAMLAQDPLRRWNRLEAMETYGIARWGCGYFDISDTGNLIVTPRGPGNGTMDMRELIDELTGRGIQLPILLRFSDILRARIELICGAFNGAMKEYDYKGQYRGVYPIKVNQNRTVVEEIIEYGRPFHYGLEAGSKPELLTVMAIHQDDEALIICNGYKDEEYIETALLASKLGRTVVLVVEKPSELDQIHRVAERVGIRPTLGMRARLSSRGAGRWEQSGGDFSKFGLSAAEMVEAVGKLKSWGQVETLKLLHFHLGSQISAIKSIKNALREAGRLFVELYKLGASGLSYCDVGGGLGVDYDGSQTNFASSMNYSVQEYANDIVYTLKEICDADNVPHPHIVSESGRAVTAHHSVLVVNVLGVTEFDTDVPKEIKQPTAPLVKNLWETYQSVSPKTLLESYHDALEYKDQVLQLFNLGHLSLEHRVLCENLFWAVCDKVLHLVRSQPHMPEELEGLEKALSRIRTSATSRCSSRCPTPGRSISSSRSARSIGSTRSRPGAPRWPTSPATPTARSTRSSICATSSTSSSCTPRRTARTTTWACSWSAPIRRSWATCTTCSATPTPSMSSSGPTATTTSRTSSPATRSARCWASSTTRRAICWAGCAPTSRSRCARSSSRSRSRAT
jgi:arginine decarboxylase